MYPESAALGVGTGINTDQIAVSPCQAAARHGALYES